MLKIFIYNITSLRHNSYLKELDIAKTILLNINRELMVNIFRILKHGRKTT